MMKKRVLAAALAVCCLLCAALCSCLAEDCFTIDIDLLDLDSLNSDAYVARELSASTQGVRVVKYISDSSELAAPIRLTLTQMDTGSILFDKDYGVQSHTFDSGVIYLPYAGDRTTPYLVKLTAGNYVYAMPFMQLARETASSEDSGWQEPAGDSWENDGWDNAGWDNGGWEDDGWSDSGWEDGWESDAPGWE